MTTRTYRIEANAGTESLASVQTRLFGRICAAAWMVSATSAKAAIAKAAKSLQRPIDTLHVCHVQN